MGEVHLLAAALRTDRSDVESYARVLSAVLGDALPAGMVEVARQRSFADRVAGREGSPVALRVRTDDRKLELRAAKHGGVTAEVHRIVRGVVISRRTVGVDEWLGELAQELAKLATRDAAARTALSRLIEG
jgi:diphthamide synthase (EF-2-diphthine--ammonia ligase)